MKTLTTACWVLASALAEMLASQVSADEVPAWAVAFESTFEKAYNSRAAEGFDRYYAEDAQVNDWKGLEAIRAGIKQEWERDDLLCEDDLRALKVVNGYAIGDGRSGCWPKGGSPDDAYVSEWLTVWKRRPDGQWRVILEQWPDQE